MKNRGCVNCQNIAIFCLFLFNEAFAVNADFFNINMISVQQKSSRKDDAKFEEKNSITKTSLRIFRPHVKVSLTTQEQIYSMNLFAKAYFYTKDMNLITTMSSPTPVDRNDGSGMAAMPVFFPKGKRAQVYFALPAEVLKSSHWNVLIVFGDRFGAVAASYPRRNQQITVFNFPEKERVLNPLTVERSNVVNPLIEHTVKTGIPKYPQITLFLRKPIGTKDFSDTKGVLAICVLANGISEIKKQLQEADKKSELSAIFNFAEKHKLAIICWGARSFWNPRANWNEVKRQEYARMDDIFDDVAQAWRRGILSLSRKYGIPAKDYLLMGYSGSAQYVARLALRQPQYFLAVHVHIPSSFDRPNARANKILWCLTTGEEESGYERSLKFLTECQSLKYPIIYKAIPKLGHSCHPQATHLGLTFFEYALTWQHQRQAFENKEILGIKTSSDGNNLETFSTPAYWGDVFRQQVYSATMPATERPPAVLVPLPTEAIARAWEGK